MKILFQEVPEAIANTLEVAEKCNLEIEFDKLHYPVFTPPEHFTRGGYLRHLLIEGLGKRYGIGARLDDQEFVVENIADVRRLPTYPVARTEPLAEPSGKSFNDLKDPEIAAAVQAILDRLEVEIKTIEKTGFIDYFLIVGDFVRYGRSRGIACVARGSAAGSIVTFLLEISNVDPIGYGLLFERFLNPERVNPPDIERYTRQLAILPSPPGFMVHRELGLLIMLRCHCA